MPQAFFIYFLTAILLRVLWQLFWFFIPILNFLDFDSFEFFECWAIELPNCMTNCFKPISKMVGYLLLNF